MSFGWAGRRCIRITLGHVVGRCWCRRSFGMLVRRCTIVPAVCKRYFRFLFRCRAVSILLEQGCGWTQTRSGQCRERHEWCQRSVWTWRWHRCCRCPFCWNSFWRLSWVRHLGWHLLLVLPAWCPQCRASVSSRSGVPSSRSRSHR